MPYTPKVEATGNNNNVVLKRGKRLSKTTSVLDVLQSGKRIAQVGDLMRNDRTMAIHGSLASPPGSQEAIWLHLQGPRRQSGFTSRVPKGNMASSPRS
jgi:hypothetical protein